jgi:haloacetate dehalogenase
MVKLSRPDLAELRALVVIPQLSLRRPEWREKAIHDHATVRAKLEDHRAGLGVDREHEEAYCQVSRTVRARRCSCGRLGRAWRTLYGDPLALGRSWVGDLRGAPIESGHHKAEEIPAT